MWMLPAARATRAVSALLPTSTICAWPALSKWVRVWSVTGGYARLRIAGSAVVTGLRYHSTMRFAQRLVAVLAFSLVLHAAAADDLPELGDVASNDLSLPTEKRIGQQIMHEIRWRDPSYLDDPDVEAYLNQLGGRLAAVSNDPGLGFYFFPDQRPKHQRICHARRLYRGAHRPDPVRTG
jgi:hypothetical protein